MDLVIGQDAYELFADELLDGALSRSEVSKCVEWSWRALSYIAQKNYKSLTQEEVDKLLYNFTDALTFLEDTFSQHPILPLLVFMQLAQPSLPRTILFFDSFDPTAYRKSLQDFLKLPVCKRLQYAWFAYRKQRQLKLLLEQQAIRRPHAYAALRGLIDSIFSDLNRTSTQLNMPRFHGASSDLTVEPSEATVAEFHAHVAKLLAWQTSINLKGNEFQAKSAALQSLEFLQLLHGETSGTGNQKSQQLLRQQRIDWVLLGTSAIIMALLLGFLVMMFYTALTM